LKLEKKSFNLKIILVEPNGPLNVGSIARLCSNFSVQELRIVSPKCDIFSLDSKRMALKGKSYLDQCKIYKSLNESIADCDLVLATSGRTNLSKVSNEDSFERISSWISDFKNIKNLAIIFGREDKGLTNKELLMAQKVFRINTSYKNYSLNLSHAVSIVLYELQKISNNKNKDSKEIFNLASPYQIEESFKEIKNLLLKIGYFLPHTSNIKISKFKKYIFKAETSKNELNIIRGIVHQINWALKNSDKI